MAQECSFPGCPMVVTKGDRCRSHPRLGGRRRGSKALNTRPKGRHWTKLRDATLKRDGYRCRAEVRGGQQCQVHDPTGKLLRVHHIIGLKEGGSNELSNLVVLCIDHHEAIEAEKRAAR